MDILHIASFAGNSGDSISHAGTDKIFNQIFGDKLNITRNEIRKTYKIYNGSDKWQFDDDFVERANKYDLVIIGGGNFLDPSISTEPHSTIYNISTRNLDNLVSPLILASIGCNPLGNVSDRGKHILGNFIDAVSRKDNIQVLLRNDGSKDWLLQHVSSVLPSNVRQVLDSGYFYHYNKSYTVPNTAKYFVCNIGFDQVKSRLNGEAKKVKKFYKNMAILLENIIKEQDIDIVFTPHVYWDLEGICKVIEELPPILVRERVSVAPVIPGSNGADFIMEYYAGAEFVITMRLHSLVACIAMNVPMHPIIPHDRIDKMLDSLGIKSQGVDIEKVVQLDKGAIPKFNVGSATHYSREKLSLLKNETIRAYENACELLVGKRKSK